MLLMIHMRTLKVGIWVAKVGERIVLPVPGVVLAVCLLGSCEDDVAERVVVVRATLSQNKPAGASSIQSALQASVTGNT